MKLIIFLLFKLSVYHAIPDQTDSTPLQTADMSVIDLDNFPENWVAVPRHLLWDGLEFGDEIEIICDCPYSGVWEIHDVMNNRYTYCDVIDVLIGLDDKIGLWDAKIIY